MKYLALLITFAVFFSYFDNCSATTEPVCGYKNSQGELIFLKYLPYLKKGEDYVDFGNDGKCLKRATCLADFSLKIEECSDVQLNCENRNLYNDGVFPKCCVKC